MSIRKQSAVIHISWEELSEMCNSIAGQLKFGKKPSSIKPVDQRDIIPANIIAYKLGIPADGSGSTPITFSITSEKLPKTCFFHLEHESELFTRKIEYLIRSIPVDIEGEYQRFTMPWEK